MKTDLEIEARLRRTYRTIADHTDTDLELPDESGRAPATLLGDGEASGLRPMRRPRLLLAAALAVLLGIAAALATLAGDQHKEPVRTRLGYDRGAPFLPDAPIKARYGATTVWTGEEMLVLGGYNDDDGDGEFDETAGLGPRPRDVAAYNPATRTWRTIAPLPDKVRGGSLAVWTGRVVVLVYRPGRDAHAGGHADRCGVRPGRGRVASPRRPPSGRRGLPPQGRVHDLDR